MFCTSYTSVFILENKIIEKHFFHIIDLILSVSTLSFLGTFSAQAVDLITIQKQLQKS
jgi:hypothetical protein